MAYRVEFSPRAAKNLSRLPSEIGRRIYDRCMDLAGDPRPHGVSKLKDQALDGWRIRIGDYRVLYYIEDTAELVSIFNIDLRAEAYKKR